MNVEHLTVYYDEKLGYVVDTDGPDNDDGTRHGGTSGERHPTPESAGAYVIRELRAMSGQKPRAPGYIEWTQLADSRIMATCDDCVMGPKDEGCEFCGYAGYTG